MNSPATIDSADLRALMDSAMPPRVLDVRTPGEFDTAHMPGAYNVPLDLLREHRDEISRTWIRTWCWCVALGSALHRLRRRYAGPA